MKNENMVSTIEVVAVNKSSNYKEESKMITVNKLTSWEMMDKYLEYVCKYEAGILELTTEVVNEIGLLLESEDIIYNEIKNLLKKFDCTDDEAMYYASERMVDGNQMLRTVRINYYLREMEVM